MTAGSHVHTPRSPPPARTGTQHRPPASGQPPTPLPDPPDPAPGLSPAPSGPTAASPPGSASAAGPRHPPLPLAAIDASRAGSAVPAGGGGGACLPACPPELGGTERSPPPSQSSGVGLKASASREPAAPPGSRPLPSRHPGPPAPPQRRSRDPALGGRRRSRERSPRPLPRARAPSRHVMRRGGRGEEREGGGAGRQGSAGRHLRCGQPLSGRRGFIEEGCGAGGRAGVPSGPSGVAERDPPEPGTGPNGRSVRAGRAMGRAERTAPSASHMV